jgi:hypothetical protein
MELALGRALQVSGPVDCITWHTPVVGVVLSSVRWDGRARQGRVRGASFRQRRRCHPSQPVGTVGSFRGDFLARLNFQLTAGAALPSVAGRSMCQSTVRALLPGVPFALPARLVLSSERPGADLRLHTSRVTFSAGGPASRLLPASRPTSLV